MAKITPQNTVRFNQQKLDAFAAQLGRPAGDIIDTLARSIKSGHAPPHILALQADKYDDAFIYVIAGKDAARLLYIADDRAQAARHHELEYKLGMADFIPSGGLRSLYPFQSKMFLCVGSEYFNYDDNTFRGAEICEHILKEAREPMQAPRIWWDESNGTYAVVTPYSEKFVMYLKLIPKDQKRRDFEHGIWYIAPNVIDQVKKKVEEIFGYVSFVGPNTGRITQAAPSDTFSKFVRLIGYEAMNKVYREAAMRFHSDRGGDDAKMAELNVLWKQVKEVLK